MYKIEENKIVLKSRQSIVNLFKKFSFSQNRNVNLAVLISVLSLILFFTIAFFSPFKDKLLSTLFPKPPSHASTIGYYLRADGTAANKGASTSCSSATTAMSIATHDLESFSPGDIIYICDSGGKYQSQLTPPSSGTVGNPIIYQPAPGQNPVFDGSKIVTGWISEGSNIWSAPFSGGGATRLTFFDGVRGNLKDSVTALTQSRDFYYDSVARKMYTYSATNPTTTYTNPGVEGVIRAWNVYINGKSDITFMGNIKITYGLFLMYIVSSPRIIVDGLTFTQGAGGIINRGNASIEIKNNHFSQMYFMLNGMANAEDGAGVNFSSVDSPNFSVHDNTFTNIGGYGIGLDSYQTTGGSIYNNILDNVTSDPLNPEPYGLEIRDNTLVYGNEIKNSGSTTATSTALQSNGNGNNIYRNKVHDNRGAGINARWALTNVIISYNLVYHNQAEGIYVETYGSTLRSKIVNNTVYNNCLSKGIANFVLENLDSVDVKNNIISNSGNSLEFYIGPSTASQDIDHNLYYHPAGGNYFNYRGALVNLTSWKNYGNDKNSPNPSDPLFNNVALYDLTLTQSSPAKDVGIDVGLTSDNLGNPLNGLPDAGAYEIQNLITTTPSPTITVAPTATSIPIPTPTNISTPIPTTVPISSNLLQNGSFEGGVAPWFLNVISPASGSLLSAANVAVNGNSSATINVNTSAPQSWYVQFRQDNLSLIAGKTYVVTFWAKANKRLKINYTLQQMYSPYTAFFNKSINLSTKWQKYSYTYNATANNSNILLGFNLANTKASIWIDNVSLISN